MESSWKGRLLNIKNVKDLIHNTGLQLSSESLTIIIHRLSENIKEQINLIPNHMPKYTKGKQRNQSLKRKTIKATDFESSLSEFPNLKTQNIEKLKDEIRNL